ncbi:glycosyltransferase [Patescibacteria group bacterium]
MKEKISVVMFSMSPYSEWVIEKKANRNYHVLKQLEKDDRIEKIISVDFLPHTIKRALTSFYKEQIKLKVGKTVRSDASTRVRKINEKTYVYETVDSVLSTEMLSRKLSEVLDQLKFNNRVVWSFIPTFIGYYGNVSESVSVFDTVDNWAEHPTYKKIRKRLNRNYEYINENVDVIFTVTEHLLHSLYPHHKNAYYIPNGVDVHHFQDEYDEPKDMQSIPHPRFGYGGVIQNRVDFNMIKHAASTYPEYQFVFVGPVWPDAGDHVVKGMKNVHFLGKKGYDEWPAYLQNFDVGIIPHTIDKFVKSMNPLKMYEYLACGKSVVTTPVSGLSMFKDVVNVAKSGDEFTSILPQALDQNTLELKQKRIEAVRSHSWENRVQMMLKSIFSVLNK